MAVDIAADKAHMANDQAAVVSEEHHAMVHRAVAVALIMVAHSREAIHRRQQHRDSATLDHRMAVRLTQMEHRLHMVDMDTHDSRLKHLDPHRKKITAFFSFRLNEIS